MINKETLKIFSDLIFREMGIVYKEINYYQLESRIESLMLEHKMSIEQFLTAIFTEKRTDLLHQIYDQATNNETSFFRDPKVFQSLFTHFIKPFFEKTPDRVLNIWSVACSTGQEPYSLAMDLENFRSINKDVNYRILASDYSHRVLKKAQEGIYSQVEIQRGLSPANLGRYFEKVAEQAEEANQRWRIKPQVKVQLTFRHFNLLSPNWTIPKGQFDLIFCRNVLIYQDPNNRREILKRMSEHLSEDGCLVLGCAEAITNLPEIYGSQQLGDAIIYRLARSAAGRSDVA